MTIAKATAPTPKPSRAAQALHAIATGQPLPPETVTKPKPADAAAGTGKPYIHKPTTPDLNELLREVVGIRKSTRNR